MIRSFIFHKGKLLSQDTPLDLLAQILCDEEGHIWVDLEAPTDEEVNEVLEKIFAFHPLSIEDCLAVSEHPKVEEYDRYIFMVVHAVSLPVHDFQTTELDLFIGKNFLVTFHRQPLNSVTTATERIVRNPTSAARAPDRLTYTLLQFLFENYQPAMEQLSESISKLEEEVLESPQKAVMSEVMNLKRQVLRMRQIVYPQREVMARITRGEFKIVHTRLLPYYRDLLDQLMRISDRADSYREALTSVLQMQLNLQQTQINKVIKVLTVLTTLFLPLLVLTSFYGMNVQHEPNLSWTWQHAYAFILGLAAACTAVIYGIMKLRRWM